MYYCLPIDIIYVLLSHWRHPLCNTVSTGETSYIILPKKNSFSKKYSRPKNTLSKKILSPEKYSYPKNIPSLKNTLARKMLSPKKYFCTTSIFA
jgi:hypothetical protein